MEKIFSLIETIWHTGVLLFSLTCFGGFATIVYQLGKSALNLHQRGLISLVEPNCALQGDKLRKECGHVKRVARKPNGHAR